MGSSCAQLLISLSVVLVAIWPTFLAVGREQQLVGGRKELVDLGDEGALRAAEAAVTELNRMSNSRDQEVVLVRIVEGTVQVVAGLRYRLVIEVGLSELGGCPDDEKTATPKECPIQTGSVQLWYADVWMKPTNANMEYEVLELKLKDT